MALWISRESIESEFETGRKRNTLVLLSIIKFESLKAIPDLFIFSLSFTKSYLEMSRFFGYCSLIASITNIFGVTVKRLISVRFPLKYDLFVTTRRDVVTLICIWIFSVTIGAIMTRSYIPKIYIPAYFIYQLLEQCQFIFTFLSSPNDSRRPPLLNCKTDLPFAGNIRQQRQSL